MGGGRAWGSSQEGGRGSTGARGGGEHLGSPLLGPAGAQWAVEGAEQAREGQKARQPGR